MARGLSLAIRGIHRDLREVLNEMPLFGDDPPIAVFENPGRGRFDSAVAPIGRYHAVELSVNRVGREIPPFRSPMSGRGSTATMGVFRQDNDLGANGGTVSTRRQCTMLSGHLA
jgi:hypothetical protein